MMNKRVFYSAAKGKFYGSNSNPDQSPHAFAFDAQAIVPHDIADIEAVTILEEVLGLARPQYTMRNVCRPIRMDSLTARIDIATKLTGSEKVPPLHEADINAQAYSNVDFDLWKNVVHVVIADEAAKKAAHDVMALHIQDAGGDLARMENSQIVTALEGATKTSAGSDWGGANNPFVDLETAFGSIEGTYGYTPDFIAAHPLVWAAFFGNDKVKGQLQGQTRPEGKVFPVPGLPGITGISEWAMTNTLAVVGSRAAPGLVLGEGPTEAARYRDEKAGYDAYIIRQWLEPKRVVNNALYKLTAVHA